MQGIRHARAAITAPLVPGTLLAPEPPRFGRTADRRARCAGEGGWTVRAVLVASLLAAALASCRDEPRIGSADAEREQTAERRPPAPSFAPVTDAALTALQAAGSEWLTYGGAYNNQRYSSLSQITRENVSALTPAWVYQTGVAESFETTPIVAGNVMYLTTPQSGVIALHAATGEKIWEFRPEIRRTQLCCGPNNRGVSIYGDHVHVATLDARLIALDRRSGQVVWDTEVADPADGYSLTMAPLAFDGKVFVGVSGADYGLRGFVSAYDAATGELVWRWYTIPAPGEAPNGWWGEWRDTDPFGTPLGRDIAAERKDSATYRDAWKRGGGAVWMTPAYDPATKTLYFSVGNPAPSLDGRVRPGDNLYTGSIVALDGQTGKLRWYFQYLPHDVWDLAPASPPILFDLDGRRYVAQAGKTGWLYVVDAASGQPVLRSDNFVPQDALFTTVAAGDDPADGRLMIPGAHGGTHWSPIAYSPRTGLAYVLGVHQPMVYRVTRQPFYEGRLWTGGTFLMPPDLPQWGTFSAIDLRTGEIRWQRRVPAPMLGAALVTAGDVVFVGQGTGTLDAFDALTGDLLWQFNTGAGVHGGPITYAVDGVQYVAVAAGGNYQLGTPKGDDVFAFVLGQAPRPAPSQAYAPAEYRRSGPIHYGAVRQVPAASVNQGRPGEPTSQDR